ncbi:MAG: cytochrome c-type biogenesis protein [Pseudomonadota bacterium]
MRKLATSLLIVVSLLVSTAINAFAVNPDEVLEDPVLEERARALSVEIRCLVCQNQSIDDSDAQLARDLRVLVREKLVEGLSDDEILDFLVARYGEFVLLKPRFNAGTFVLWIAPFAVLLLAGSVLFMVARNKKAISSQDVRLSDEERSALEKILDESK